MDLLVGRRKIPDPTHDRQNRATHFRCGSIDGNERPTLLSVPGDLNQPEAGALSRQNRYRFGRSSARTQSLVPNLAASIAEGQSPAPPLHAAAGTNPKCQSDGRAQGQDPQVARASLVR